MKRRIRIQGMLMFLAVLLAILLRSFIFQNWGAPSLDMVFDLIGLVMIFKGFLLRITARGYKEENSAYGHALVANGPYAYTRNPMYLGTLLIGLGVTLILFKIWVVAIYLVVYLTIYIYQIKKEEVWLLREFGKEYTDYCLTTPRFFPCICRLPEFIQSLRFKSAWVKKERQSFLIVFFMVMAVEAVNDIRSFGFKAFAVEFILLMSVLAILLRVAAFLKRSEI
jgi:protein-S-isoprenylcysteine O-methyltransferase Ste14